MHVDYADIEETAFDPQLAHSVVDWPPPNHAPLHFAHHDKSCAQLMSIAAALVDGITIPIRMYRRPFPANLLQRYDVELADPQYFGKNAGTSQEIERLTVP